MFNLYNYYNYYTNYYYLQIYNYSFDKPGIHFTVLGFLNKIDKNKYCMLLRIWKNNFDK